MNLPDPIAEAMKPFAPKPEPVVPVKPYPDWADKPCHDQTTDGTPLRPGS